MVTPRRRVIGQPAKRVISTSQPSATQPDTQSTDTVDVSMDVQPADIPIATLPDATQAVDYSGKPIEVGMLVDIYSAKVVGLKADPSNHLNVLILPFTNTVVCADPNHPLTGQTDGKALLVSGYNCLAYDAAKADNVDRKALLAEAKVKAEELVKEKDSLADSEPLPSNFMAPSFV